MLVRGLAHRSHASGAGVSLILRRSCGVVAAARLIDTRRMLFPDKKLLRLRFAFASPFRSDLESGGGIRTHGLASRTMPWQMVFMRRSFLYHIVQPRSRETSQRLL